MDRRRRCGGGFGAVQLMRRVGLDFPLAAHLIEAGIGDHHHRGVVEQGILHHRAILELGLILAGDVTSDGAVQRDPNGG